MKRLILFLSFLECSILIGLNAQNLLTTKDGKMVLAYDMILNDSIVYFRTEENHSSPITQIHQSEIVSIKDYQELLAKEMERMERNVKLRIPEYVETGKAAEVNSSLIESYNSSKFTYELKNPQKIKKAQKVIGELSLDDGSILINEDVSMECVINSKDFNFLGSHINTFWSKGLSQHPYEPSFFITVANRTDSTIYVDLGKSFFITGDESYPYFPSSITPKPIVQYVENNGALGKLLGTVSKTEQGYTTIQRILVIPTQSCKELEPKLLFPYNRTIASFHLENKDKALDAVYFTSNVKLMDGNLFEWSIEESPIRFTALLTYSLNEEFDESKEIKATFYMSRMFAVRNSFFDYNIDKYYFKAVVE